MLWSVVLVLCLSIGFANADPSIETEALWDIADRHEYEIRMLKNIIWDLLDMLDDAREEEYIGSFRHEYISPRGAAAAKRHIEDSAWMIKCTDTLANAIWEVGVTARCDLPSRTVIITRDVILEDVVTVADEEFY